MLSAHRPNFAEVACTICTVELSCARRRSPHVQVVKLYNCLMLQIFQQFS